MVFQTGYLIEEEDHDFLSKEGKRFTLSAPGNVEIPSALDPRSWLKCRLQGPQNKCVGHGGANALTVVNWGDTAGDSKILMSREMCYLVAQTYSGHLGRDQGSNVAGLIKGLRNIGICPESLFPYRNHYSTEILPSAKQYGATHRLLEHDTFETVEESVQYMGANFGAIVLGISWTDAIANSKGLIRLADTRGNSQGGHCISLVGYTNRRDTKGRRYPLMLNSHPNWGINGYAEVEPDACQFWIEDRYSEYVGVGKMQTILPPNRTF